MSKYVSLERFFALREMSRLNEKKFIGLDASVTYKNRDFIYAERRTLKTNLSKVGIDVVIFKRGRLFCVTEEVADFFLYFLDYFFFKYAEQISHRQFADIPKTPLVELRAHFIDALYSVGYGQNTVEQNVRIFEEVTGCPSTFSTLQTGSFTSDIINYLKQMQSTVTPNPKEDSAFDLVKFMYEESSKAFSFEPKYDSTENAPDQASELSIDIQNSTLSLRTGDHLRKQDWDNLANLIEYTYRYDWYPKLVDACMALFKDYCDQLGLIYNDESMTASRFPWDKTSPADGQMGGNK